MIKAKRFDSVAVEYAVARVVLNHQTLTKLFYGNQYLHQKSEKGFCGRVVVFDKGDLLMYITLTSLSNTVSYLKRFIGRVRQQTSRVFYKI